MSSSATFDFSTAVNQNNGHVTQTVAGVTVDASTDSGGLGLWNNELFDTSNQGTYLMFQFSQPIEVSSFVVGFYTNSGTVGHFEIQGFNDAATYTYSATPAYNDLWNSGTPAYAVNLNWGLLSSIKISLYPNDASVHVGFDADSIAFTAPVLNTPPAIGGAAAGQAVNDNAAIAPFSSLTITDPDAAQTQTVSVTLDAAEQGTLSNLGAGSYDAVNGVYSFTGTAGAAQAAVQGLLFTPAANRVAPGSTETTTFTVSVDDGSGAVVDAGSSVVSTSINDAPAGTSASVSTLEDMPYAFTAADFGFTDPNDNPANTLENVVISSLPTAGSLKLDGSEVGLNQVISAAAVTGLRFIPAANANGAAYAGFGFKVQDNGGVANGGMDTDMTERTMTMNVGAVNDAPTGRVSITGTAAPGQILSAHNNLADADKIPTGAIYYQWQADGLAIDGATADTYTLTQNEAGKAISAAASYTDGGGTVETVTSGLIIQGSAANDVLSGGSGNDSLSGDAGNDLLFGGNGHDSLNGGPGADSLIGEAGNDTYLVDNIADVVVEKLNAGKDTVISEVSYTLPANVENLTLTGLAAIDGSGNNGPNSLIGNAAANILNGGIGNDTLNGGSGADNLTGAIGKDRLIGGDGPDILNGSEGNDILHGGAGRDTLNGGTGNDVLLGGSGQDVFIFNSALGHNKDKILGFVVADDSIQLDSAIFTRLANPGVIDAGNFTVGVAAVDDNDYVIYNPATGALLYDADGNTAGGVLAIPIAILGVNLALTNANIAVI